MQRADAEIMIRRNDERQCKSRKNTEKNTRTCRWNLSHIKIYRISKRGVPHLVIESYYSVCYFGKNRFLRVFKGYATPENGKLIDLKTREDVIFYLNKILER